MTSWNRKAVVLIMIAGQLMASAMAGRVIYLAHCGDPGHGEHENPAADCGGDDACLALVGHDHQVEPGHDHRCQCTHIHVRNDAQRTERTRLAEGLRRLTGSPALDAVLTGQNALSAAEKTGFAVGSRPHTGLPQPLLALRSVRLLV